MILTEEIFAQLFAAVSTLTFVLTIATWGTLNASRAAAAVLVPAMERKFNARKHGRRRAIVPVPAEPVTL